MDVVLHDSAMPLGKLVFVTVGHQALSQFAYHNDWLTSPQFFQVSPDLKRQSGYQLHHRNISGVRKRAALRPSRVRP